MAKVLRLKLIMTKPFAVYVITLAKALFLHLILGRIIYCNFRNYLGNVQETLVK